MNVPTLLERTQDRSAVLAERPLADDTPSRAILYAFTQTDLDLRATSTTLHEHLDVDALDALFADAEASETLQIAMEIWGHPVLLTSGVVYVFEPTN